MFGLIVLGALGIYLVLLIAVTWLSYRAASKSGLPLGKRLLAAGAGFLLIYLPVFWDHIPTIMAHQYYCEKEAGFWVYKTVEQWKAENPGVMETLVDNSPNKYPNWPTESWNGQKIASINQRFGMLYKNHLSNADEGEIVLNVWRWKTELVDKSTGDVLARQIDFSSGNGYIGGEPPIKFWLQNSQCENGKGQDERFGQFILRLRGGAK